MYYGAESFIRGGESVDDAGCLDTAEFEKIDAVGFREHGMRMGFDDVR